MNELASRRCSVLEPTDKVLTDEERNRYLGMLKGWELSEDKRSLHRRFSFQDFYQTIAFVNAIAWVAHHDDHHPDLRVRYDTVDVTYTSHILGGLSLNDMICAAKVSMLLS